VREICSPDSKGRFRYGLTSGSCLKLADGAPFLRISLAVRWRSAETPHVEGRRRRGRGLKVHGVARAAGQRAHPRADEGTGPVGDEVPELRLQPRCGRDARGQHTRIRIVGSDGLLEAQRWEPR